MPKVLVTGANGYIGNAVAKAFNRAGWTTYGLIRRNEDAADLAQNEIHPIVGTPEALVKNKGAECVFDVVVSNTEDWSNYGAHFHQVKDMLAHIGKCSWDLEGIRTLVLFSSGCKDYGMTGRHGDADLSPHTESSLLNAVPFLLPRTDSAAGLLADGKKGLQPFDVVVLRPTNLYGYGSSHLGTIFAWAEKAKKEGRNVLQVAADPNTIIHSTHVDDCALAYVKLAEHSRRDEIVGQAFNISNSKYETTREVCEALARSYGLSVDYQDPKPLEDIRLGMIEAILQYSQWVSSDKIRRTIGWKELRAFFCDDLEKYRTAYEAALTAKHQGTTKIYEVFQDLNVSHLQ